MSNTVYFSDMFHDFGDFSIELNNALNTLVRSYRKNLSTNDIEKAKEKLLTLLTLIVEQEGKIDSLRNRQVKRILEDFVKKNNVTAEVNSIQKKIEKDEKLSESEIDILDDLISQISREATAAFRRMRKVI